MNILVLVMLVATVIIAIWSAVKAPNLTWVCCILLAICVALMSGAGNMRLG